MSLTFSEAVPYLFLTSVLIITFSITITIFGSIFYKFIEESTKRKWNLNFIQKIFLFFGIGVSIYISVCYLIAIFKLMNFFTIYLPIILIDIFYFLFLLNHENFFRQKYYKAVKKKLLLFNKDKLIFILILIFILYLSVIFYWKIIAHNKSIIGIDSIDNFGKFSKGLEYGYIPSEYTIIYPQGFRILCMGCLSLFISPDLRTIYYFFKLSPLLYISFYIFVLAIILKSTFKKNIIVLFGLLGVLSTNVFHYRSIEFLPSNIATLLVLISIIILISDCPKYILGFFISAIYLINPIVAFFYLLSLTIYFFARLILTYKEFYHLFAEIINTIFLAIGLSLPFIIYLILSGYTIYELLETYRNFSGNSLQLIDKQFLLDLNRPFFSEEQLDYLTNWVSDKNHPWLERQYRNNTIIFSYYFFMGAILIFFLKDKNYKDISLFGKSVTIIILFFFFLPIIFPNDNLITPIPFWIKFRMLEIFCAPIIIMECCVINYILIKSKILTYYLIIKINYYKKLINKKGIFRFLKIENILTFLIISSCYSNYYIIRQEYDNPWPVYHYSEEQIEAIFFIKENIQKGSKLLVPEYLDYSSKNEIYEILYDYKYYFWDFSIENSYNETKKYCYRNDIEYILIDLNTINQYQLSLFYLNNINFKEIFKNARNVILKTKNDLGKTHDFGIYQATWNFMDEDVGEQGYDLSFVTYYSYSDFCSASISKNVYDHMNVLDLYSNNQNNGYVSVHNNLGCGEDTLNSPTFGTIEFWWQTTDINQSSDIDLYGNSNNITLEIKINKTQLQYYDGLSWKLINFNILNNKWYHIRIDFECSNKSYMGLKQNCFAVYINNILELYDIDFVNMTENVNRIKLSSYQNSNSFHTYIDAIGYSWDYNYNVGDNWKKIYL